MTPNSYDRFIQLVRVITAVAFGVCAAGVLICVNLQISEPLAYAFLIGAGISLAIVPVLVIEQLIAAWLSVRGRFTILSLLLLMVVAGIIFAVMRLSLELGIAATVLAIVVAGAAVERWRRPK